MALFGFINPWFVALGLIGWIIATIWSRHLAADYKIKRLGATRAPIILMNPISALGHYYGLFKAQRKHQAAEHATNYMDNYFSEKKDFYEMSPTGSRRILLTRDPEQIKAILTTKFSDFGHGPKWHRLWKPFLGNGIFAVDGQMWHDSRSMIRPMFIKDRIGNLKIFDDCTDKLLSKLPAPGVTVDLQDLFYRWTLDTTFSFLLGGSANSLDNPEHEVANAMAIAQKKQMLIFVLNAFQPIIPKTDYYEAIGALERFIDPFIARAISLSESELEELSKSDESFTFLHSIARYTKDPRTIRDQIMSIILAGRDTTASALSWAIYELCGRKGAWEKLRTEVLQVLGRDKKPNYETLKDLTYVRYVLNETLRLHPSVPMNMRQAIEDTTIPGEPGQPPIAMLKGDSVTYLTREMHLRKENYPPVSEKFEDHMIFSPERWEHWTPKPWTYTPFHGGPRICVGQNFALTEMAYCLVRLAQKYAHIEYRGDWNAQFLKTEIIGAPGLPIEVALFEE